ncbi:MAG: hydrolase TatD [Chitinophagaceae bacterium]|nr:MAG: hydrolase TatD [Chitinophagaceae bacterium]
MSQSSFINIHTHSPAQPGEFAIQSRYKDFGIAPAAPFSAGLHPWYLSRNTWQSELKEIAKTATNPQMLAVGECGLDKVCQTEYVLQKEVLIAQVALANQINKPLILHCVRAHEELMQLLEQEHNQVPAIFHGFNKGLALAEKIILKGHYISFGTALERPHMEEIFAALPMTHIFLETDDAAVPIEYIYKIACAIRKISTEELGLQLQQNVQKVFNFLV